MTTLLVATRAEAYDTHFAYERLLRDVCGRSPVRAERDAFAAQGEEARLETIRSTLATCMREPYWRGVDGVLWQMGHRKIRPLQVLKSGRDGGTVPLGDYDDDYNLFVYHHVDGHDVRGLLTADYFVTRTDEPLTYAIVEEMPLHPKAGGHTATLGELAGGTQQFVVKERRAGLLTTKWALAIGTMFASLPRVAAAQALRAYLGLDLAKGHATDRTTPGHELQDYDNRGIKAAGCAGCHNVLDPLSYPFSRYVGLNDNLAEHKQAIADFIAADDAPGLKELGLGDTPLILPGTYKSQRIAVLAAARRETEPRLAELPEAGSFLGKPVSDLREWAAAAVASDEFAKTVVLDFWRLLVAPTVSTADAPTYERLWRNLTTVHRYSVEAMILELVSSDVYGTP